MSNFELETINESVSDECGCPEHEIMLGHIYAIAHIEPDGSGDVFVDFGDWNEEWHFKSCAGIEDLKIQALNKFNNLPILH